MVGLVQVLNATLLGSSCVGSNGGASDGIGDDTRSTSTSAASAVIVLVVEKTLAMVFSVHGAVRASSAQRRRVIAHEASIAQSRLMVASSARPILGHGPEPGGGDAGLSRPTRRAG